MKLLFYTFGLLGLLGTWGRASLDGTLVHLFDALHGSQGYVLPGTNSPLRESFTGIYWPVDYMLRVLVVVFWEAVDGSRPGTSAVGFYFLGQLFPILTDTLAAVVPGLRNWKHGFLMGVGLYSFLPNYVDVYLIRGPADRFSGLAADDTFHPARTRSWIYTSCNLDGITVPKARVQRLPATGSGVLECVSIARIRFSSNIRHHYPDTDRAAEKSIGNLSRQSSSMRPILAGSISTLLFPALFNPKYVTELGPASVFLPPISIDRGDSVGAGFRSFFLWDQAAGYPVMIMVMIMQLRTAYMSRGVSTSWAKMIGSAVLISLVAGPGSACLALSWWRDEILFGVEGEDGRKDK
ncbi:MAG: hypothetical protein Q9215_005829 [Flavoplaca cf. flavocitrina]